PLLDGAIRGQSEPLSVFRSARIGSAPARTAAPVSAGMLLRERDEPSPGPLNVFFTWKLVGSSSVIAARALPAANVMAAARATTRRRRTSDMVFFLPP